ncbi:hypothetical protein BDN71DRAFT_1440709 [Pleurotus eryngii]|uniref:Phosphotransferase n=1 Tax=Pleurotus eryngii TaxID=5323 RepID=A0A9P6A6Y7_PLEER|nr:hypothetical protein BDN71DRAFT_1440709 [Pleurotus eryngii]
MASTSALFSHDAQRVFDDIDRHFQLSKETLVELTQAFIDEYRLGLGSYGKPMAMIPTFVTGVPDGTETGTFLALDLGGTNLRVCEVVLNGDKTFSLRQQKYRVSEELKTGEATALFDYLADSVDAFLTENTPSEPIPPMRVPTMPIPGSQDVVHLGLTFSFPVEQTALGAGKILTWTKGFSAKNAIGHDVVQLLQDAFDRKHLHVKCVALVNDTVGALLSRAYTAGGCILGAIFGTGTNGAFVEQVANITKLGNSGAAAKGGLMVVNTEWGAFNNSRSHLPSTPFDNALDRRSINPRFQAFEKFVSGMYLGEIARNIIMALIDAAPKPLLLSGKFAPLLNTQWGLDTSVMSDIENAWEEEKRTERSPEDVMPLFTEFDESKLSENVKARLQRVRKTMVQRLGYEDEDVTLRDAAIVKWACGLVARRAALLSGVAVAATLIQTGRASLRAGHDNITNSEGAEDEEKIGVGVDGSLIEHYPHFEHMMRESLKILVGEHIEKRVDIGMAKDGSGVGAALCALMASKEMQ